ncbi:MAG TPA: hypothetical protein VIY29_05435 [Ktedonobacteraceae bacterium]
MFDQIPIPQSGIWGNQAFQGWGISGLLTLQSGQPFTVGDSLAGGAYGFTGGTPLAVLFLASSASQGSHVSDARVCFVLLALFPFAGSGLKKPRRIRLRSAPAIAAAYVGG